MDERRERRAEAARDERARAASPFREWLATPLPPSSTDEVVDALHADLLRWDAWVADVAIPVAGGRRFREGRRDVRGALQALLDRTAALAERRPRDATLVAYADYLRLLQRVYEAAATGD